MLSRRIFAWFLILSSGVGAVFANFLTDPFNTIFGQTGLFDLLKDKYVVVSLIFVMVLLGFNAILKVLMKPIFGSGHQKEGNVVAFSLSLIGSLGIFFVFRDSPEQMIVLFGGSVGFLFFLILSFGFIFFIHGVFAGSDNENMKNRSPKWWVPMVFSVGFCSLLLSLYLERAFSIGLGASNGLWDNVYRALQSLYGWAFLIGIIGLFFFFKKKNANQDFYKKNPDVVKAQEYEKNIRKNLQNINGHLKKIKTLMGRHDL